MRERLIYTILLTGFLCAPAFAQGVEIFGGAQYEHQQPSYNAVGWNTSLTGNFKHVLGITGDFSGVYNSHRTNSTVYTYTVGPVLTARLPVFSPSCMPCSAARQFRLKGRATPPSPCSLAAAWTSGFGKGSDYAWCRQIGF